MRRQRISAIAVAALLLLTAGVGPAVAVSGSVAGAATGSTATAATGSSAVAATAAQADCSFPVTSTDATGTEVTVEQRPERVTTLSPSAAQTMWEIGGKSQVVGVTQYASYLEGADERTNVSGAGQSFVNVEAVVATESDLVLAPNVVPNSTVERLREAGLTVYKFGFATSVDDIYAKTELMGRLTGNCEGAAETVASMRDRLATVREAVENSDEPSVFVSQGGGWTAGSGTFINNVVELAGGNNIAVDANISGYGQISEEVIVQQDPEWIVQIGQFGVVPDTEAYNNTYAVQNDQIVTVSNENISQPAPRVVNAIVKMAKAFHPEAYAEANATTTTVAETSTTTAETTTTATGESAENGETTTTEAVTATEVTETGPTATTTEEVAMQDETTTEESSGAIPGFGVPAAVAALAGAALLARRR